MAPKQPKQKHSWLAETLEPWAVEVLVIILIDVYIVGDVSC